jgi:DNA (cytosine-5)-methyltransferase 1
MRLLDLFCGAGGAAMGYHEAGFEVVGVDIKPQPRYPFEFHQGDALEFLAAHGHEFDAIHASPPCQAFSVATKSERRHLHADLVAPTRNLLTLTGKPWVIENVPGAPVTAHFKLTGRQFGLKLARARLFETNWAALVMSPPIVYDGEVITVVGHGTPGWAKKKLGRNPSIAEKRDAMGIHWMNRDELSQAIPPAYTKFIGEQLMLELRRAA